jgi:nucleoside-diphosphate-sugar epimerase
MSDIEPATLRNSTVLVTGASGLFGAALVLALAAHNEVVAAARFSDADTRRRLEEAGATTATFDLSNPDQSVLPEHVDVVFHCGAAVPGKNTQAEMFEINAQASGRLVSRYRNCRAFVHCSTAGVYARKAEGSYTESDLLGVDRHPNPDYPLSKIAGEQLVRFLSVEYGVPTVILRIFALYGPGGGFPTQLMQKVAAGEPVPLPPIRPILQNPMFETDFVEKAIAAASVASVPPLTINFAGVEQVSIEEYTRLAGELFGRPTTYVDVPVGYSPSPADTTAMVATLGPTRFTTSEGVHRVVEAIRRSGVD